MEKWSELPPEILHSISLRIDNSFDLIHFRCHWNIMPTQKNGKLEYWSLGCVGKKLLNSGDKVLLVEMCTERRADFFIPNIREKKIWFEVSELDVERNDWNQVEDVDDRVLFLEQYCSFSCLATEIQGFRANSIIFSDLWGGTNLNEHESILVYEFNEQGVRSVEDIPEYVELFPSPPGWVISNA